MHLTALTATQHPMNNLSAAKTATPILRAPNTNSSRCQDGRGEASGVGGDGGSLAPALLSSHSLHACGLRQLLRQVGRLLQGLLVQQVGHLCAPCSTSHQHSTPTCGDVRVLMPEPAVACRHAADMVTTQQA